MRRLLFWVGLVLVLEHHDGAAHKLVCYFSNWAYSRPAPASILPQDLDPFLCTHLIFAFASMENNQIVAKNAQDENIFYPEFNKLKKKNRALKTLLSIGGWDFGTKRSEFSIIMAHPPCHQQTTSQGPLRNVVILFTAMLSTPTSREKFIDSVISLLRTHDFDGLDLFFLYPGIRGSPRHDRWNFLFLLEELKFAFTKEAIENMHPKLLLSAAVSGIPSIIHTSYDVHLLGRCLDFINILSYDFHGPWENITGHNSPLFSRSEDPKSSAYVMNYWRMFGAPSEKLIMGLPTYGRTFRLLQESETGLGARAVGPASAGKYTKQDGFLAYFEICSFIWRAKKIWIKDQFVPYAYKGKKWVGYDDVASFTYKAMFIKREHFGGAMVWTLDLDDVKGVFCGNGRFPLVRILKTLLVQDGEVTVPDKHRNGEDVIEEKTVTPGREMMTLEKLKVTLKKKTRTPTSHMTVPPGEMTMTSMNLQTQTTGRMTVAPSRESVISEKVTVPSGRMAVNSGAQVKILRREKCDFQGEH